MKINSLATQFKFAFFSLPVMLVGLLVFYAGHNQINNENKLKESVAAQVSQSVMEKVDRNFYERFGDVQAFAANVLAYQIAMHQDSVKAVAQRFINTMTSYYVLYDLMMVIDLQGNVVLYNTVDKSGNGIATSTLAGKNFSGTEWFRMCTSKKGPEGGAWYSDLIANHDVAQIYHTRGLGMEYAAPIRTAGGNVVGVWYNFASWKEVTQDIRQEALHALLASNPGSEIFLVNKNGYIIDATNQNFILNESIDIENTKEGNLGVMIDDQDVNDDDYIIASANSKGAYTYKGKSWVAVTVIPRVRLSIAALFNYELGLIILVVAIISILFANYFGRNVTRKILTLKESINRLSQGDLSQNTMQLQGRDELNQMENAILQLTDGLNKTSHFAQEVGAGNFDTSFTPLSEKDTLGNSLLQMRENLKRNAEADKKRMWGTTGLAKFGDMLREGSDMKKLSEKILNNLVKYIKANQGAIFIVNDQDGENPVLELVSCYAFDRKKYNQKIINPGDGLLGQAYLEKNTIHITRVPEEYLTITSGLGDSPPRSLLIVPLKDHERIEGLIELASLKDFEPHEIEFVQQLAESIAVTFSNIKVNERTRMLFEEGQQRTEEMKAQEEEMRQNFEELSATQEEMQRKEREYIQLIDNLKEKLATAHGNVNA